MLTQIPRQEIENRIKEITDDSNAPSLSKKLNAPHLITINTKNWFESSEKPWNRKIKNKFILPISIDKKYLTRTLLIVDFLVKLLEYRGHLFKIVRDNHNVVIMNEREINISIRNVGKYVENNDSYRSRDFIFTEMLCIQMYEDTWNRKEWKDTPHSGLEEKLIRVIAYSELYAEYSYRYHLQLKESWRQNEIIRQEEIQKKIEIEKEIKKVEKLIMEAENFDKAKKIEKYLTERKEWLMQNNLFTNEEKLYFDWGIQQYKRLNPLLNITINNSK